MGYNSQIFENEQVLTHNDMNNIIAGIDELYSLFQEESHSEDEALARFVAEMKTKAKKIGMDISIQGPAGYPENQISNGKSLVKLYAMAAGYDELAKIWHTPYYRIYTKENRPIDLYSSVFYTDSSHFASDLTDYYFMFGGKTGTTGPGNRLLGCIMEAPEGRQFVAWLSTKVMTESPGKNRHAAMKLLMDIAYQKYHDSNSDVSSIENQMVDMGVIAAAVILVPQTPNLLHYESYNFHKKEMINTGEKITSIDEIAFSDKTYRDIFITNNKITEGNMTTSNSLPDLVQYSTVPLPTVTTSEYNTSDNCVYISCTNSQQGYIVFSDGLTANHSYYLACKRKMPTYTKGSWCGFQVTAGKNDSDFSGDIASAKITSSNISNEFKTASELVTVSQNYAKAQYWIGCGGSANLTAYIDDLVFIDLTEIFGTQIPTKSDMDLLYENFLSLHNNEAVDVFSYEYATPYPVYEYHADDKVNIASNTKVLTSITALDYVDDLDEYITIGERIDGSNSGVQPGEKITIRDALYCLMLPSCNTCAYSIAKHIGNKLLNIYPNPQP